MSPAEAAKLLDLPAGATPEELEARFLELRRKLEDKIAKAPTPGLQAKYRESLTEITAAFETLVLAADSSALPVLQKETGGRNVGSPLAGGPSAARPQGPALQESSAPHDSPNPKSRIQNRKSGKEFFLVALIAVAVLGAGAWFVMKTRAENAEKARIAAEAKAEAERVAEEKRLADEAAKLAQAAAEKEERERLEALNAKLRSRLAELNVSFEAVMRSEQVAERELSELKSEQRSLRETDTPAYRALGARVQAQDRYVDWLRDNLPAHPAKIARAQAEELLNARSFDAAATAVEHYAKSLEQLQTDVATAKAANVTTGTLVIEGNTKGVQWQVTDSFGVERKGTAPATLDDVALGPVQVTLSLEGFPNAAYAVNLAPATPARLVSNFIYPTLTIYPEPANASIRIEATTAEAGRAVRLRPGTFVIQVSAPGHASTEFQLRATPGEKLVRRVILSDRPANRAVQLAWEGLMRESDATFLTGYPATRIAWAYGSLRSHHPGALEQVQDIVKGSGGPKAVSLAAALAQVAAGHGWASESNAAVNVAYQPLNEKKLDAKTFPSNPVLIALILSQQAKSIDNAYGWYRAQMEQRNVASYIAHDLLRLDRLDLAEEWMQRWRSTEKAASQAWEQGFGENYYTAKLFEAHVSANRSEEAAATLERFLRHVAQPGNFTNLEWCIPAALRVAHQKGHRSLFDLVLRRVEPLVRQPPAGQSVPDWWYEMLFLAGRADEAKAGVRALIQQQRAASEKQLAYVSTVATYAKILLAEGDVTQAYESAGLAHEPADVMTQLASAHAEQGDWTGAAEAYRRAPLVRRHNNNYSEPTMNDTKALRDTMLRTAVNYGAAVGRRQPTEEGLASILAVKDRQVRLLALAGFAQHLIDAGQSREAVVENVAPPRG